MAIPPKTGVPHTTTAVRIPTRLYDRLKEFGKKEDRSISWTVARALEMFLAAVGNPATEEPRQ